MKRAALLAMVLGLATWCDAAKGEVPRASEQELEKRASHIVAGKLRTVYRSVSRDQQYETTDGLAELMIDGVEKGDGLKPGEVVFARFWNQHWIGKGLPPPGSTGHYVPKPGSQVRAYLERAKDGTFEVILPNGLAEAKP